jgi:N-acetylneuraminate synthase
MAFAFSSVVATRDIGIGEILDENNIWVKRPGGGAFGPEDLGSLYGREVTRKIHGNRQLSPEDLIDITKG